MDEEVLFDDGDELVSTTDLQGVITYVNDTFCRIAGYDVEDLIGQHHNIVRHSDMPKAAFKAGPDYALVDFCPNKISALNLASQQARCIFPATLSFSGCAFIKLSNLRLTVARFFAPSSAYI